MKNKLYTLALATLILAGCTNSNQYVDLEQNFIQKQSKNLAINYKPNINIVTKDTQLLEYIKQSNEKNFNVTKPSFAVMNLFIDSSLELDPLEKSQPNLVGILKKKSHRYNYKVSYKLVDGIKNPIVQSNTLGLSDEWVESLAVPTRASDESIKDAAVQIIEDINNEIRDTLIDFKIISVSSQSVFIIINDGIKLNKNELFLVNEMPSTALRLEGIIQHNDITMAELKIITGNFPKMGMTVNLQK